MDVVSPYQCTNCLCELTNGRILCAECTDVQLCLHCFSYGAEIGSHERRHKYKILGDFSLFKSTIKKWTARDELSLLTAVEKLGYGNWKEIARFVRRDLSAEDVKQHYNEISVNGHMGQVTLQPLTPLNIADHTVTENGPLSASLSPEAFEIPIEYQQQLVYFPSRDDYEKEFDNDAEILVKELQFSRNDDEVASSLKLVRVRMYNDRLRQRFYLKKIVKEHNKISQFFNSLNKPKPLVTNRKHPKNCLRVEDFLERMQIYSRFFTNAELLHFFQSLQKERELKQKARALIKLRILGFRNIDESKKAGLTSFKREKNNNKLPFIFFIGSKYFPNKPLNGIKRRRRKRKLKFTRRKGYPAR